MKNGVRKRSLWQFKILFALLIPILSGATNPASFEVYCPAPQVSVTGLSTGSASFSWNVVNEASEYVVFYVRQADQYTSQQTYTPNTSITFSGLPTGVYDFYFATVCGSEVSSYIIIEDLII